MGFLVQLKAFLKKYSYAWVLLYFFIYMIWFNYLEKTVTADSRYNVIYSKIDDLIPFNELFVIPYTLWFPFVGIAVLLFLLFCPKNEFLKFTSFLFIGMTICLIIYTIHPNGQELRPTTFARDNILVDMVKNYYKGDTPTNVCPSIHCLNSIAVAVAVLTSEKTRGKKLLKISTTLFAILIMMSTVSIKQHSIIDVVAATALAAVLYTLIYLPDYSEAVAFFRAQAARIKERFIIKE